MSLMYYSPGDYGLEPVAEIDVREADYSFDIAMVWRDKTTGKLYGAFDSGCSCPSPFEDYNSVTDLTPIHSVADADRLITDSWCGDDGSCHGDRQAFLSKVRLALRGNTVETLGQSLDSH